MTQRMKDKVIGGFIGTASGLIVGIVLFFFGGVKTEAQAFRELVDSKVDAVYYEKDQKTRWDNHDKIQIEKDKRFEDVYRWTKFLYEQKINESD